MRWTTIIPLSLTVGLLVGCPDEELDDDTYDPYGEGDEPGEVAASLVVDPDAIFVGETVEFDAGASTDSWGVEAWYSDCDLFEFQWDFGDGETGTTEIYFTDHTYTEVGTYTVTLTVVGPGGEDTTTDEVEVMYPLPNVDQVDVSVDGAAVIGEWIAVLGSEFREENLPTATFGGTAVATQLRFVHDTEFLIRVPPRSPSGTQPLALDFPEDDGGDTEVDIWVKRYAVATDSFHDTVSFVSFGDHPDFQQESQDLDVADATLVKITGDGATAIIGDGRWDVNITPTLNFVDLTADFQPAVTHIASDIGLGPLFDIATAVDIAVIADAIGINVIDLSDPYNPYSVGRTNYPLEDLAATDVELTPDGTLAVVLGTFDDTVRFYEIDFYGATLIGDIVQAGDGIQDVQITDDGQYAYVLSGGGEGALPPDLNLGNTCVTVVDLAAAPYANYLGDGVCVGIDDHAPIPFDLALATDYSTYISSFDQNFGNVATAFEDIFNDPADLGAWEDLLDSLVNLSWGGVVEVTGVQTGAPVQGQSWFLPYGLQTGLDVRYDELFYVSAGIYLDFVYDLENILDPFAAITMTNGVAVVNIETGDVTDIVLGSDPILYYENFQLDYDYMPLVTLLLPPYSFGDVAIQP